MKIIKIINQHRRDFNAEIECESCGNKEILKGGYDDRYYHDKVLPDRKCQKCDKSRNDLKIKGEQTATKYADNEVV